LLVKELDKFAHGLVIEIVFNAEVMSQLLCCVALVDNNALLLVSSKVDVDEEQRLDLFFFAFSFALFVVDL